MTHNPSRIEQRTVVPLPTRHLRLIVDREERASIEAWAAERIQREPAKPSFGERLVAYFRGNGIVTAFCVFSVVFSAAVFIAAYAGRLGQ